MRDTAGWASTPNTDLPPYKRIRSPTGWAPEGGGCKIKKKKNQKSGEGWAVAKLPTAPKQDQSQRLNAPVNASLLYFNL